MADKKPIDSLIRKVQQESTKKKLQVPKPMPQAPDEFAPGYYINKESGFALAKAKRKKRALGRIAYG